MAPKIVPNVNRLAQAVRATDGKVVWIQTAFIEESLEDWSVLHGMALPARTEKRIEALSRGGKGYELWAELEVKPEDLIVEKLRFSAFIQGSSNLADVLRTHGLDTVLITGNPMASASSTTRLHGSCRVGRTNRSAARIGSQIFFLRRICAAFQSGTTWKPRNQNMKPKPTAAKIAQPTPRDKYPPEDVPPGADASFALGANDIAARITPASVTAIPIPRSA